MAYFLNPKNCEPDSTNILNGVTVKEYLLTKHNPNKISLPAKMVGAPIGVTVHNTDDLPNIEDDGRNYTASTVNGNMGTVRIHYYVDDLCAWQNMPLDYQSWHAGQSGTSPAHGSEAGNAKTISIECIMNGSTGEMNVKAEDNAARLAAWLLCKYGLKIDNLYTHNYWVNIRKGRTGTVDYLNMTNDGYKNCPIFIRPHWLDFKAKVEAYMKALSGNTAQAKYCVQVGAFRERVYANNFLTEVRKTYKDSFLNIVNGIYYVQVGAFSSRENAEKYLAEVMKKYPGAFIKTI